MKKTTSLLAITLLSAFLLTGCNDKGKDFVGHWYQENAKNKPNDINITFSDGVYHINTNMYDPFLLEYDKTKLEGKAESDSVLSIIDKMKPTMRLESGKLYYGSSVYMKK